jgi:hypothetical protein
VLLRVFGSDTTLGSIGARLWNRWSLSVEYAITDADIDLDF